MSAPRRAPKRPAKSSAKAGTTSAKKSTTTSAKKPATKPSKKPPTKRPSAPTKAASPRARAAAGAPRAAAATPIAASPASRVISATTAATWSNVLPRTPRLMVPIAVDALMVRADGGAWADVGMRTPTEDGTNARDLMPPPFAEKDGGRTRGAYLHWALPDALTRGVMPDDSTDATAVQFPAVPDRWLVVRLSPGSAPTQRAVRGWVLLAGGATPVVVDLDAFVEPGPGQDGNDGSADVRAPLTALGHGDPAWAAYFDNVENRLGFHDPLADVAAGPLAYMVCGWHASDALDPLGGPDAQVATVRLARMRELGWSVADEDLAHANDHTARTVVAAQALGLAVGSRAAVDGIGAPSDPGGLLSLYHGSIVGLGWPSAAGGLLGSADGVETGGPPPASAVDVVIAPTMVEAVAALSTPVAQPLQARVVASVAAGTQGVLDTAAGRADVDAALHARAFVSFNGGDATETVWQPPTVPQPTPPGRPPRPLSDAVLASAATAFTRAVETPAPSPAPPPRPRFEPIAATRRDAPWLRAVTDVRAATLQEVIGGVTPAPPLAPAPSEPGKFVEVTRPLPRFHAPADPVLLVRGARRAFRHGGDGRFTHDGTLACRLSGACVTALSALPPGAAATARVVVRPETLLARSLGNGSIPAECEDLLRETVLLDPGSAGAAAGAFVGVPSATSTPPLAQTLVVEQTAWWALREPRLDAAPVLVSSGLEGTLPSPVAVTPPVKPWTPLHIDWEAEYLPSPAGERDWSLGEIDLGPSDSSVATPLVLQGRALLSSGPATLLGGVATDTRAQAQRIGTAVTLPIDHRARFASDVAQTLTQAISALDVAPGITDAAAALSDVASRLADSDLLAGSLDPFHVDLRGGVPGDGSATSSDGARPAPFIALRAGFLRIRRLRLVDTYGQFLDLAGSDANTPVDPARLRWAGGLAVTDQPDRGALPPRFTAPARLMLRYTDGAGGSHEADDLVSPVCGFLLPNHLEDALEAFDAAGSALGTLSGQGDGGLAWEETPGQAGTVGRAPERSVPNPFLAGVLRGLLDYRAIDAAAGATESSLSAFLRLVDSTRWSVDPFAHAGDEHLSLLVGHPIAVLRARVWLEVVDPVAPGDAAGHAVPVRLGSLAEWQDGLYGYYLDDDYRRLHLPDGAAARFARPLGPGQGFLQRIDQVANYYAQFSDDLTSDDASGTAALSHPMIDGSGMLWLVPGRVVRLTMLVEPHASIHATTGYLPRKSIGMRRRWVTPGLARLAPTFRFGPVLVDPNGLRMPVARDVGGTWSWQSRADVGQWNSEPITNSTGEAALSPGRVRATEGWLRLVPDPPADDGSGGAAGEGS